MKKIFSSNYNAWQFNLAMLVLRVGAGILLASHGFQKLTHFHEFSAQFMNWMGLGAKASLSLVIFAEFFCAIFVILGLFTRLASIPILISLSVAVFQAHNAEFFGKGELGSLYILIFLVILLLGPGRVSVDGAVSK